MLNYKTYIFLILLLLLPLSLYSQDAGTTSASFLKLGAGARAVGMGSAFTGLSDDVSAIYWNPAGLGFIRRWELSLNYQKLYADFDFYSLFFARQFKAFHSNKVALGIGIVHLGLREDWDSTNGQMPAVGSGDVSDLAIILPLAYRLDFISEKLSCGLNYKYIKNTLGNYDSHAHGLDFGLLFKTELTSHLGWSIGANFQNKTLKKVKFIDQKEGLPYRLRAGTALKIFLTDNQDLILSYDLAKPKDNNLNHNMGLEYWLHLGSHRLGFRGGYRMIDEDLGKLSLSVGYGFDINTVSQGAYFSEIDYAMNNYDSEVLGNVNMGSFTIKPTGPEPFKRLSPKMNTQFKSSISYMLSWQETFDCDELQRIKYLIVLDTTYNKIEKAINNAKNLIQKIQAGERNFDLLFCQITADTQTQFEFAHATDVQDFYWAVIAYNRNFNMHAATGSDIIGKFSNRNLPDLIPVSLNFSPIDQLSTSKYQGLLEGGVVGKTKQPCKVAIFDSTDNKIICSDLIPEMAAGDTFKFSGKWIAEKLGSHKLNVIADFGDNIEERVESNNVLSKNISTILWGHVSAPDTVKLEKLSYEHIELPTIPYIFFEPNSTEFSEHSRTGNESEPDSLLKLFGERLLNDFPGLKITIQGYIDPHSEKSTLKNQRLSTLRAQKVRQKLIEYGARESQLIISTSQDDIAPRLERKSTQVDQEEVAMLNEENRCVEIRLPINLPATKKVEYDKRFFAPRLIKRQKNEIFSKKIPFNFELNSTTPIKEIYIFIRDYPHDPFPIKVIHVKSPSNTENININYNWDGIKDNGIMAAFNKPYFYWTSVIDCTGKKYEASMRKFFISRDVIVKEKRIFALAQFNKVAPLHQFYLEQLDQVEDMMKKNPRIRVRFFGHTDIIGTEERNNELSSDRAMELANWLAKLIDIDYSLKDSLKKELKSRIDNPLVIQPESVEQRFFFGKGEHFPLIAKNTVYGNNDSPQGRTLNRRVDIEIYRKGDLKKPPLTIKKNITFHPWYQLIAFPKYASDEWQDFKVSSNSDALFYQKYLDYSSKNLAAPVLLASAETEFFSGNFSTSGLLLFQDSTIVATQSDTTLNTVALKTQPDDTLKQLNVKTDTASVKVAAKFENEIDVDLINQVRCIELAESVLWLGTNNGLLKWYAEKDTFELYKMDFIKYRGITALKFDAARKWLYVGTQKGLRIFQDGKWITEFNVWNGLSGNEISSIVMLNNKSKDVLLGTNEGINIFGKNGVSVYANMDFGLTDDYINDIYQTDDGILWACTNKGVNQQIGNKRWEAFAGNSHLPSDTVNCMVIDNNGDKWFGTALGLCKFDQNNQRQKFTTFELYDKIRSTKILNLRKDQLGNIWCNTKYGLSLLKDDVWYSYNYQDGLPSSYITMIIVGQNNQKYVSANGGGLSIIK